MAIRPGTPESIDDHLERVEARFDHHPTGAGGTRSASGPGGSATGHPAAAHSDTGSARSTGSTARSSTGHHDTCTAGNTGSSTSTASKARSASNGHHAARSNTRRSTARNPTRRHHAACCNTRGAGPGGGYSAGSAPSHESTRPTAGSGDTTRDRPSDSGHTVRRRASGLTGTAPKGDTNGHREGETGKPGARQRQVSFHEQKPRIKRSCCKDKYTVRQYESKAWLPHSRRAGSTSSQARVSTLTFPYCDTDN